MRIQFLLKVSTLLNEMRRDYLLNRWVVIATHRRKRPIDFAKREEEVVRRPAICPLCPGNEHMTPPAVLVYLPSKRGIVKERDQDGFRHKGWLVRCVPNLYPAFTPQGGDEKERSKKSYMVARAATGHHEVLVESPRHEEHLGVARISQIVHIVNAYLDRLRSLSMEKYVKYVSIFRNHGREAGASLSHAHSQIIAMPLVPRVLEEELEGSRRFWTEMGKCIFCRILREEKESPRFIWENNHFIAFAPWASIHPFEFWVFPKKHQSTLLELSQVEIKAFAKALRVCFGGLRTLLNDPPYNFGFHVAPSKGSHHFYHWHLEVYPRLGIWAGLEKSVGMFINVVSPEKAAESLRTAVLTECERLAPK